MLETDRVVTLSGGWLEAKTCGRFASYTATNVDVSETRLTFLYSIDTWNCSCCKQLVLCTVQCCVFRLFILSKNSLFTAKRCLSRRFVLSKNSLFTMKVVVSAESKSQLLFTLEHTTGCLSLCQMHRSWTADSHNCIVRVCGAAPAVVGGVGTCAALDTDLGAGWR